MQGTGIQCKHCGTPLRRGAVVEDLVEEVVQGGHRVLTAEQPHPPRQHAIAHHLGRFRKQLAVGVSTSVWEVPAASAVIVFPDNAPVMSVVTGRPEVA